MQYVTQYTTSCRHLDVIFVIELYHTKVIILQR